MSMNAPGIEVDIGLLEVFIDPEFTS